MPAKLFLVRHGETESNVQQVYQGQGNSRLTENGMLMAEELAEFLSNLDFKGIYCSDLSRGLRTAEIIAQYHGVTPRAMPELRERDFGAWEGLNFSEIAKQYPDLYALWLQKPAQAVIPQAETLAALQARGVAALQQIIDRHQNFEDNICIVGHGGINRALLFHYLNLDLDHFWKIRQSNCCINVIEYGARRTMVSLLNSTGHVKKAQTGDLRVY